MLVVATGTIGSLWIKLKQRAIKTLSEMRIRGGQLFSRKIDLRSPVENERIRHKQVGQTEENLPIITSWTTS